MYIRTRRKKLLKNIFECGNKTADEADQCLTVHTLNIPFHQQLIRGVVNK